MPNLRRGPYAPIDLSNRASIPTTHVFGRRPESSRQRRRRVAATHSLLNSGLDAHDLHSTVDPPRTSWIERRVEELQQEIVGEANGAIATNSTPPLRTSHTTQNLPMLAGNGNNGGESTGAARRGQYPQGRINASFGIYLTRRAAADYSLATNPPRPRGMDSMDPPVDPFRNQRKMTTKKTQVPDRISTDLECPICRDPIVDSKWLVVTGCNHHYCAECLGKWLMPPMTMNCPMCRGTLWSVIKARVSKSGKVDRKTMQEGHYGVIWNSIRED